MVSSGFAQRLYCAIKASDFVEGGGESRAAYRRPRRDFEREVETFLKTHHRNVFEMCEIGSRERVYCYEEDERLIR